MTINLVSDWFGESFQALHPLLQQLHRHGGTLQGAVDIYTPRGFAGFIGRALTRNLCIPVNGKNHRLSVNISHHADGLHWDRCFDDALWMRSTFLPIGRLPDGHWVEKTGGIALTLTVDVIDGGWHWRCLGVTLAGIPMPRWLFPSSTAYKTIENGKYRFYVGLSLPLLGTVLSYGGMLTAIAKD
jgi:Domain of unknown function (DUF4166)